MDLITKNFIENCRKDFKLKISKPKKSKNITKNRIIDMAKIQLDALEKSITNENLLVQFILAEIKVLKIEIEILESKNYIKKTENFNSILDDVDKSLKSIINEN